MDTNEIAKHIDVLHRMAVSQKDGAFVTMNVWPTNYHGLGQYTITAHYLEHVTKSNDPLEAIEKMYKLLIDGSASKPNHDVLARTLGLNDTPSWIDLKVAS